MGPLEFLILGVVVLFGCASFFFALAESCLFSLGRWRARQLAERHPRQGAVILRLLEKPSELLASISLGNTVANGMIITLALVPALRERWPLLPTLAGTLILILVG